MKQKVKDITPYMATLRDKILDTAMQAFSEKGIKAVKMDDIARSLGISKRTLYQIYDNKESLLLEGVRKYKQQKDAELSEIYDGSSNVMDVILFAYRKKVEEFNKTCPEFYADIIKYKSVTEFFMEDYRQAHEHMIGFLERGVSEGYFRNDLNLELIARMLNALTKYILEQMLYKDYPIEQIFYNLLFVSLRGFCTPQGTKQLDLYLADIKK